MRYLCVTFLVLTWAFSAQALTFQIKGSVKLAGTLQAYHSLTISAPGFSTQIQTDSNGYYQTQVVTSNSGKVFARTLDCLGAVLEDSTSFNSLTTVAVIDLEGCKSKWLKVAGKVRNNQGLPIWIFFSADQFNTHFDSVQCSTNGDYYHLLHPPVDGQLDIQFENCKGLLEHITAPFQFKDSIYRDLNYCNQIPSFTVKGIVNNRGSFPVNHPVWIEAPGVKRQLTTQSGGSYSSLLNPNKTSGPVYVKTLDCYGDTLRDTLSYSLATHILSSYFQGCQDQSIWVNGQLGSRQPDSARIYFSVDRFHSVFDSVTVRQASNYTKRLIPGISSGKLYIRLENCVEEVLEDSLAFNLYDILNHQVVYCPYTGPIYEGQIRGKGQDLLPGEAQIQVYEHQGQRLVLKDTLEVLEEGRFYLPGEAGAYYLLKALPKESTGLLPGYYRNSHFWQDTAANAIGPHTQSIAWNLAEETPLSGSGTIDGEVSEHFGIEQPGANLPIMLRQNNGKVVAFTYTDAQGEFSFNGLDPGRYQVYLDWAGLPTVAPEVEVVAGEQYKVHLTANKRGIHYDQFLASDEHSEEIGIHCWPNPFQDQLQVKTSFPVLEEVELTNLQGNRIFYGDQLPGTFLLNTADWPPGIYLIKIKLNEQVLVKKLLKN
ncbi:carboxypeptidase regulatory-like domain-containing protein [bacterium SCSIO 12741]|nr:carboxypeptidase regulatory-like domain-containing protein [bacterium SCSIO 12741]